MNGAPHSGKCTAAADIRDGTVYLSIARITSLLQQSSNSHNHSRLAIPTLRYLMRDPCLLNPMECSVLGQTLDRGNSGAIGSRHWQGTRTYSTPIQVYGAGPARRNSAPKLRARQAERVADHPKQRCVWFQIKRMGLPIHRERDCHEVIGPYP